MASVSRKPHTRVLFLQYSADGRSSYTSGSRVEMDDFQALPVRFQVKDAAEILGLTAGGLRGAILRGKLPAEKGDDGKHYIKAIDVASYHLYGFAWPEAEMANGQRQALEDYLKTVIS